jgi:hypothetical protein
LLFSEIQKKMATVVILSSNADIPSGILFDKLNVCPLVRGRVEKALGDSV